jgi:hypothetical protein
MAGAVGFSLSAHAAIGLALALTWAHVQPTPEPAPIAVTLVEAPIPTLTPQASAADKPQPVKSSPPPKPQPSDAPPRPRPEVYGTGSGAMLSDSQLAGAASADSGSGDRACDMARRVQAALRRDQLAQAAVAKARGRAIMVWNGDWVQSQDEDGKGLSAVREAIMWEIAFSPAACRAEPMRGLILLSMNGGARIAVGSSQWRWSDLLLTNDTPGH